MFKMGVHMKSIWTELYKIVQIMSSVQNYKSLVSESLNWLLTRGDLGVYTLNIHGQFVQDLVQKRLYTV